MKKRMGVNQGSAMNRHSVNWEEMFRALEAFRKECGHCQVQANFRKNPQLGRWVAMQRYRRKIGEMPQNQIDRLEKIGFVWSPTDVGWNRMYQKLVQFKQQQGHCDVPSVWPPDPRLASWVANQRHRRKTGTLLPERAKRMDDLGFAWALYGKAKGGAPVLSEKSAERELAVVIDVVDERLYHLVSHGYVQYGGTGPIPEKLQAYIKLNHGEFPPYIPLPRGPLTFVLQNDNSRTGRKFKWSGRGAIPEPVREYVNENGVLPQYREETGAR